MSKLDPATVEACAKWHEHRADLETNSLHCGDNSMTISSAHRVAAFHRFSARELRALCPMSLQHHREGGS